MSAVGSGWQGRLRKRTPNHFRWSIEIKAKNAEKYLPALRNRSKAAEVVREAVVSGRVPGWPLVFCPLRETGHVGGRQAVLRREGVN